MHTNSSAAEDGIRRESWGRYWSHGFLTSCCSAFSQNYEGTLWSAWAGFFEDLPQNARILDIGTGNGAVAVIANQIAQRDKKAFEIHGIDCAPIDPHETVKGDRELLRGIHFHSETASEHTPFSDGYFDAFTGQYALEYSHIEQSLAEIKRLSRSGARCMFVMHHPDSVVVQTTREELENGRLIFQETRLFDAAEALIRRVGRSRTPQQREALSGDPQAEARRHRLNRAAARISEAVQSSPHPELLRTALGMVSSAYKAVDKHGLGHALQQLHHSEMEIRANIVRLQDLMRATVTLEQLRKIEAQLGGLGFRVEPVVELYHDDERLMGWMLRAT